MAEFDKSQGIFKIEILAAQSSYLMHFLWAFLWSKTFRHKLSSLHKNYKFIGQPYDILFIGFTFRIS